MLKGLKNKIFLSCFMSLITLNTQSNPEQLTAIASTVVGPASPFDWQFEEEMPEHCGEYTKPKTTVLKNPFEKSIKDPSKMQICKSRENKPIKCIVISCYPGDFAHHIRRFLEGNVSVHYYINRSGTVIQLIPDSHKALSLYSARSNIHNNEKDISLADHAIFVWLEAPFSCNKDLIFQNMKNVSFKTHDQYTQAQINSLSNLVNFLAEKYQVHPLDIFSKADCFIQSLNEKKQAGYPFRAHPNLPHVHFPGPFVPYKHIEKAAFVDITDLENFDHKPILQKLQQELETDSKFDALPEIEKQKILFVYACEKFGYFIPLNKTLATNPTFANKSKKKNSIKNQAKWKQYQLTPELFELVLLRAKFRLYNMDVDLSTFKPKTFAIPLFNKKEHISDKLKAKERLIFEKELQLDAEFDTLTTDKKERIFYVFACEKFGYKIPKKHINANEPAWKKYDLDQELFALVFIRSKLNLYNYSLEDVQNILTDKHYDLSAFSTLDLKLLLAYLSKYKR